jgi:dihydroorotase
MRIRISGGRLVDPAGAVNAVLDLYIADGRIVAQGAAPQGFKADRTIDARNRLVIPGLVDLCARLREPGQEHKATIASECRAAVAAGITTLCVPPDTQPVIDTPAVVELIHQRAARCDLASVYALGALTRGLAGEALAEMAALKAAGCIGVSNALAPLLNSQVLRRALEYAATCGLKVHLYCEDTYLRNGGVVHEGPVSTRLGLPGIPETAETVALCRALLLVEQTGAQAHFCRLTTARAVHLIAEAQRRGLPVTADVAVTHMFLCDRDINGFNPNAHLIPPLRTEQDRDGLCAGLAAGTIAAVCSDHQPHDEDAKAQPFVATQPGASTLEALLPLTLRLAAEGAIPLMTAIAAVTWQPARILGLAVGSLQPGQTADVCIVDPESIRTITAAHLLSAGKNTPFAGWRIKGRVTHTLRAGRLVHEA